VHRLQRGERIRDLLAFCLTTGHGLALGVQDQLLLGRQRYEAHVDHF
jgi:hypothetical protein